MSEYTADKAIRVPRHVEIVFCHDPQRVMRLTKSTTGSGHHKAVKILYDFSVLRRAQRILGRHVKKPAQWNSPVPVKGRSDDFRAISHRGVTAAERGLDFGSSKKRLRGPRTSRAERRQTGALALPRLVCVH
jgi:hypothetical protein